MKNKSTIKFPAGILIWMGFKQNLAKNLRDQKRKQKDKQTTIKNYSPLVVIAVIGKNHYESEKKGKNLKNFKTIFASFKSMVQVKFGLLAMYINHKQCWLLGGVLFREIKFVLSNFLSDEDLSISYES